MIKEDIIRKLYKITLILFFLLGIYTILNVHEKETNILRTNLEIEDITNLNTDSIYLLNNDGYLVKVDIFLDSKTIDEKIEKILEYLKIDNNKSPTNLRGYIKENIKVLNYEIEGKEVKINLSKEFPKEKDKELIITGITYSLLELKDIEEVSFLVENKPIKNYSNLTKEIGINNEYIINTTNNISKIVLYYIDSTNNYYVPVTKYLNDKREKIEIIIEELKSTKKDLISYINNSTELLNYKEEENVLYLNFNNELVDKNKEVTEKVLNTIAYSVFDNYKVNTVIFEINSEKLKMIQNKS